MNKQNDNVWVENLKPFFHHPVSIYGTWILIFLIVGFFWFTISTGKIAFKFSKDEQSIGTVPNNEKKAKSDCEIEIENVHSLIDSVLSKKLIPLHQKYLMNKQFDELEDVVDNIAVLSIIKYKNLSECDCNDTDNFNLVELETKIKNLSK